MNNYHRAVWTSYFQTSRRWSQFVAMYRLLPSWMKMIYVFAAVGFILCFVIYMTIWKLAFVPAMIFELILIFFTLFGKDRLLSEFGEFYERNGPPDTLDGSEARYLLFSSELNELKLSKNHIDDCIVILEAQIRKESVPNAVGEKLITLIIGVTLGLVASIISFLNIEQILITIIMIAGIAVIVKVVVPLFPSKLQRLLELNYFLTIYNKKKNNLEQALN